MLQIEINEQLLTISTILNTINAFGYLVASSKIKFDKYKLNKELYDMEKKQHPLLTNI